MLYQDRRALACIQRGILWCGSVVSAIPIVMHFDAQTIAVAAGSATIALLAVYISLRVSVD
mgnify:CR=1 FL=1